MDYSQYEIYDFDNISAFNLSTGYKERSYQSHWHSYGEILYVGPGDTNVFMVNQKTYDLVPGDFVLIWPMEVHAIIDADRTEALVIQFSNAFMNSLFDLQRIMHFYRNLHVICINAHPQLAAHLARIAYKMKDVFFSDRSDRELRFGFCAFNRSMYSSRSITAARSVMEASSSFLRLQRLPKAREV